MRRRDPVPGGHPAVEPVYAVVLRAAFASFRALDLDFVVDGQEHVPATGGGVVVMNHTGYLDYALAGAPFWRPGRRVVRFMAKHEVFAHPLGGPLMRGMRHIPVDRSAGGPAYTASVEALRRGELVGVFPEGTISRSFELKAFKTGAARMAQEAGVPLLPVVLWGSQRVWTKGRKRAMVRDGRHVKVAISIGAPRDVAPGADVTAATGELKDAMQTQLTALQAAYGVEPTGPDDRWWLPARLGGTAPTLAEAAEIEAAVLAKRAAG